jgi:IPT/TIG domain
MHIIRRILLSASALGLILVGASAYVAGPAGAVGPALPQPAVAQQAAEWLAGQLTAQGYIPGANPGTANLSETVNTLLALGATSVDPSGAQAGLTYLAHHENAYIRAEGTDGPGQLSLLILATHALGADPTNFGGSNLVSRLLATEQTTGPDAGRFGTNAQVRDYNSGPYDQGLALAALAGVGDQLGASAMPVTWLQGAQCPDGGWTNPSKADNPCSGNPADFAGPDTNTTSLAVQGLAAQTGGLTAAVAKSALGFLIRGQDPDAGWGYDPNTSATPGTTDPDSTSLVIEALLALGQSPTSSRFAQGGATPVSALLAFQVTSGTDTGAFSYTTPATTGDILSTDQAVPALAADTFPFTPPPAPVVSSVKPDRGPNSGGTAVHIDGSNLGDIVSVSFGTLTATITRATSAGEVIVTSPAWSDAGPVNVTVTTLGGTSAVTSHDTFTYLAVG